MAYLYLNFVDNLKAGSRNPNDLYNTSLVEQYEVLKRRLGGYYSGTLQEFIAHYCPMDGNEYYISLPSFDRGIHTVVSKSGRENNYINNIIIRPTKKKYVCNILPENYELILIGDVMLGGVISVSIKGIDIIDSSIEKFGEMRVVCTAACAFSRTTLRTGASVPDYGTRDLHDSVLTNDFVDKLCKGLYPVPNPEETRKTFDDWQKYIKFRKYYLDKQSEKCEQISSVDVCDSYMISREAYRRKEEDYAPFLLDGVSAFAKGEQVIVSKEVSGSDSFPLIRIDIDKNRKEVFSVTTGKFGKGKPKFEADLQRYTLDAMGLSATEPRYENGNLPKNYRFNQYVLGERYLFAFSDIEPDCEAIENKYEKACKAAERAIDDKYASIIATELSRFMDAQKPTVTARYSQQLDDYMRGLKNTLDDEIRTNNDKEVQKEFEKAVKNLTAPIKSSYDKERQEIERRIAKLKKGKNDKDIAQLQADIAALKYKYEEDCVYAARKLNIRDFYLARNEKLIANKRKSLDIAFQVELDRIKREKEEQLRAQFREAIRSEKETSKRELTQKRDEEKAVKIENDTIVVIVFISAPMISIKR